MISSPATSRTAARTAALTEAQVRSFVDDGYLVLPGLVSPEEVAALKVDLIALARGVYPCPSLQSAPSHLSDQQVLEGLLCIHQPHAVSPVIRRYVNHPRIVAVLEQIVGAHLPHWDGAVKCMQSMLFVKPPGKPGQAWHQDEMYIPTRDRSLCGAWIAIDDATIENGCLWVLPGSHRPGYLFPTAKPTDLEEFDGSDECQGFLDARAVPVEIPAGGVVFFNGYLLHRSLRNRSGIYRRALVNHYMNSWSLLPWEAEDVAAAPGKSIARADHRRVIPVAGTDPYAWKGYDADRKDVYLRTFGRSWSDG